MKITIEFTTGNAAFEGRAFETEVEHVLGRAWCAIVDRDGAPHPLRDSNGNQVGTVSIEAEE